MFGHTHYIPILKWKRAEQGALAALKAGPKRHMTPLVQFVMPKPKSVDSGATVKTQEKALDGLISEFRLRISKIPEEIAKAWGTSPIFIDVSLLFTIGLKIEAFEGIVNKGNILRAHFIPVLHLADNEKLVKAACALVKKYKSGVCLRVIRSDLNDIGDLNARIQQFIKSSEIRQGEIDLLVDIKEIDGTNESKYQLYAQLSLQIYNLPEWRTFTFASGAFPKDLTQYKIDEENLIPRLDWKNWKTAFDGKTKHRRPAFADYAIQHPIYEESSQFYHPTTSIKYTLPEDWLVMKGRKQKFELYLANAATLVKDERFYGEDFSDGDKYTVEKAKHFAAYIKKPSLKGTGSTETWLRAGLNHHLACVVSQISSLS